MAPNRQDCFPKASTSAAAAELTVFASGESLFVEKRAGARFYENTVRHLLELSKGAARARSNGRAAQAPGYQRLAVAIAPPPPGPPPPVAQ